MKRSTNFNGMKKYRGLGLDDFVATCKSFGMTNAEIIEAVRKSTNPANKPLVRTDEAAQVEQTQ